LTGVVVDGSRKCLEISAFRHLVRSTARDHPAKVATCSDGAPGEMLGLFDDELTNLGEKYPIEK
jgi:hypothetical protein